IVTLPLLENHILLSGYAEAKLTLGVFLSFCFAYLVQKRLAMSSILGLAFSLFYLVVQKNVGIVFSCYLLLSILLARFFQGKLFYFMLAGQVAFFLIVIFIAPYFSDSINILFEYVSGIAGREIYYDQRDISEVFGSFLRAVFFNSSFSISFLALFLVLYHNQGPSAAIARAVAQFSVLVVLTWLGGSLLSDYGFRVTVVDGTGGSRFLMPMLGGLAASLAVAMGRETSLTSAIKLHAQRSR
ncbi:hypothetical protein, partial [Luminiphilus syltensis]|uniref:hypothetical protein n=1 Tax=Luminiphilus syltensis TaxID=1341119 RepID=UPI000590454A